MKVENSSQAKKTFKGSVLFTVLVVMVFLMIIMITTIGLAEVASKRAYNEYNDHQTTSTARSVVESVVYSMSTTNKTMGNNIVKQIQNGGSVDVTVNNGQNLGEGFGTVDRLTFAYVGKDNDSGINITGSGQAVIKVTAVVTQGGVTSTYSQYCLGASDTDNKIGNGGGLVALGGFEGTAQPGVDAKSPAYFGINTPFTWAKQLVLSNPNNGYLSAIVCNSSAELKTGLKVQLEEKQGVSIMGNAFTNDGTAEISVRYSDIDYTTLSAADKSKVDDVINKLTTDQNTTLALLQAKDAVFTKDYVLEKNEHGNWKTDSWNLVASKLAADADRNEAKGYVEVIRSCENDINELKLNPGRILDVQSYPDSPSAVLDLPYLYVEGALSVYDNIKLGYEGKPINVYCGRFVSTSDHTSVKGNANIFCYNTGNTAAVYTIANNATDAVAESYGKNPWSKLGSNGLSELLSWADANINAGAYKDTTQDTGSFYTLGNLELTGKVKIANDLYVKGELKVNALNEGDSHIGGNVYVEGTLTDTEKETLSKVTDGTIYVGKSNFTTTPVFYNEFTSDTGKLSLNNLKTSTVKTAEAVKNQFYKKKTVTEGGTTKEVTYFENAKNKSSLVVDKNTKVYQFNDTNVIENTIDNIKNSVAGTTHSANKHHPDGFNYKVEITDSCIIQGTLNGTTLYINPDPNATKEIWINLHNINFTNGSNIIVNDHAGEEKSVTVNFFMPTDVTDSSQVSVVGGYLDTYKEIAEKDAGTKKNFITTNSNAMIITQNYYKHLNTTGEKINLITYPTADGDTKKDNDWMLPRVGIYSPEPAVSSTSDVDLVFNNPVFITADICCPGAEFVSKSGNFEFPSEFYYNDKKVQSGHLKFIGSVIVNKIKEFNNDTGMAYVDYPSGGGPNIAGDDNYAWASLNGFAYY